MSATSSCTTSSSGDPVKLATLVYLRQDGRTLMLHRVKKERDMHAGLWNGLGGKMEEGETPAECAVREFREESGLTIKEPALRGILTFPSNVDESGETWQVFVYEANGSRGRQKRCPEGDLAWVEDKDLLSLNLNEGDYVWMPWLLERRFFEGKFLYEGKKLKKWSARLL